MLCLIVEGDGGNNFVETKHGNKFRNMNLPSVVGDQQPVDNNISTTTNRVNNPPPAYFDLQSDDEDDVQGSNLELGMLHESLCK